LFNDLLRIVLFSNSWAYAEKGYVWEGDLNGDGRIDKIQSGPMEFFGRNGPYIIRLSKGKDSWIEQIVTFGHSGINLAVEKYGSPDFRLWSYVGISAGEGMISILTMEDEIKSDGFYIFAGDQGTDLGRAIFKAIFTKDRLLQFKEIDNYIVPPRPDRKSGKW